MNKEQFTIHIQSFLEAYNIPKVYDIIAKEYVKFFKIGDEDIILDFTGVEITNSKFIELFKRIHNKYRSLTYKKFMKRTIIKGYDESYLFQIYDIIEHTLVQEIRQVSLTLGIGYILFLLFSLGIVKLHQLNVDLKQRDPVYVKYKNINSNLNYCLTKTLNINKYKALLKRSDLNFTTVTNDLTQAIYNASAKYNVNYNLIIAIIRYESQFFKYAKSYVGALGYMQIYLKYWSHLFDKTGKFNDVFFDEYNNIDAGTYVLNFYLTKNKGDIMAALLEYNGGKELITKKVINVTRSSYSYAKSILALYYKLEKNNAKF